MIINVIINGKFGFEEEFEFLWFCEQHEYESQWFVVLRESGFMIQFDLDQKLNRFCKISLIGWWLLFLIYYLKLLFKLHSYVLNNKLIHIELSDCTSNNPWIFKNALKMKKK